jgi:hypothetical protein
MPAIAGPASQLTPDQMAQLRAGQLVRNPNDLTGSNPFIGGGNGLGASGAAGGGIAPAIGGGAALTGPNGVRTSGQLQIGTNPNQGGSASTSGTGIVPGMLDVYNQLLGLNQQHYQNVLGAYQGAQGNLAQNLPSISQGYGDIENQVMGTLGQGRALGGNNWGVAQPAATAIGKAFTQAMGNSSQQMVNAGLGNTTVTANLQNMNAQNAGNAYASLGSQLAQTAAGYQSQLGLAGLGQRMQGLGMQTGLSQAAFGPLGQSFGNTAGNLTGGFSNSAAQYPNYPYGRGGYGGGGGGPPMNPGSTPYSSPVVHGDPYAGYQSGSPYQTPNPGPPAPAPASWSSPWGFTSNNYGNLGDLGNGIVGGVGTYSDLTGYGSDMVPQDMLYAGAYGNDPGNMSGGFGGGVGSYADSLGGF